MGLETFRKLGETWLIKVFLVVLALSFAAWGIGDYLVGGSQAAALKINEVEISTQDVDRVFNTTKRAIEQSIGTALTPNQIIQAGLATKILATIMQEATLLKTAKKLEMEAPTQALAQKIQKNPLFQNQGKFHMPTYKRVLQGIGYTPTGYEREQARQLKIQFVSGVFEPPLLDSKIIERRLKKAKTSVDLETLILTNRNLGKIANPKAEELQAFYKKNSFRYQTPEQRDITILTIDANSLSKNMKITPQEAKDFYAENETNFTSLEKRQASQILFQNEEKAQATAKKIKANKAFSSFNPINLGEVTKRDVTPEFAKNLFALKVGEVSNVFKTPLGYHIVKLEKTIPAKLQPFAKVQAEIMEKMKLNKSTNAYFDILEDVEDRLAGGDNLPSIAKALGLKIQNIPNFNRDNAGDLSPAIQNAAISQPEAEVSNAINLTDIKTAFVLVNQITPPALKDLAKIKPQVIIDWKAEETGKRMVALANKIAGKAKGTGLKTAASLAGVTNKVSTVSGVTKQSNGKAVWLTPAQKETLIRAKIGHTIVQPLPQAGEVAIARLLSRQIGKVSTSEIKTAQLAMSSKLGNELIGEYMGAELSKSKFTYNLPQLQQIFGDKFNQSMIPMATMEQAY